MSYQIVVAPNKQKTGTNIKQVLESEEMKGISFFFENNPQ